MRMRMQFSLHKHTCKVSLARVFVIYFSCSFRCKRKDLRQGLKTLTHFTTGVFIINVKFVATEKSYEFLLQNLILNGKLDNNQFLKERHI